MKHSYSFDEQETTINMFPTNVSKQAEIFSCIPSMMNRLRKLAEDYPSEVAIRDSEDCVFCTVPSGWIRITPKRKCTMTEEQRQENIARLARYREANKK